MNFIKEIIIALITTSLGSILAYLKAVKKSDSRIEEIKINTKNEIEKIKEESQKELNKIKAETDANIRMKLVEAELEYKRNEENIKNNVISPLSQELIKNPKKVSDTLKEIKKIEDFLKK